MDSDLEALMKRASHNLVSKLRYTDGQKVLGTQDKETNETCSRAQGWAQKFTEKWDNASHRVLCCWNDAVCMIAASRSVL